MDYIDYVLLKSGIFLLVVFVWGIYCGATGRPLQPGPRDKQAGEARGSSRAAKR